jgi:Carboxypeptidase regulatory-like domain
MNRRRQSRYVSTSAIQFAVLFALMFAVALFHAHAQDSSLSGSVQDAQKSQIAGAKITITRTESGETRNTLTNNDGNYIFPVTLPGHYDVTVEKADFRTFVKQGVQVLTGQNTVVDFSLELGQVTEQVQVSADAALLQTESSTISDVIENKAIANYALPDRRAAQLQRLNGFVTSGNTGSSSYFDVAGGRGNNANYFIDGGTVTNLIQGVETLAFDLPVDSLQEFTLSVTDYGADLGQSGGGIVQMTTKSGTNQFHGSGYIFYRSNTLQAIPDFAAVSPLTGRQINPPLNYKLYGGSIGGPVMKDKTHFFFTWEGLNEVANTLVNLSVPSAAERTGDFSAAIAALDPTGSKGLKVIDPNTGKQAIYNGRPNVLPPGELDPYGTALAAYYPLPNVASAAVNTNNFSANDPATTYSNTYVFRLDHVLGSNDLLYGRFLALPTHTDTADVCPERGTDSYGSLSHAYYYSETGTWTHTFNQSLVNELRFAFTQRQALTLSHGIHSAAEQALALPGINPSFFPGLTVQGLAAIGQTGTQERLQTPVQSNEYTDNFSWQHGNHQTKFGVDYRTAIDGDQWLPSAGGYFNFVANANISGNTAVSSLAGLLLGEVNNASRTESEYLHSLAWEFGTYVQDNWKVTPKLTVNAGIRWDLYSPRYLSNNHQNSFDETGINPVSNTPGVITFAGVNGQSKYANDFDDVMFSPRLGAAYTFNNHWVVRGGAAVLFPNEYDAATPITAYSGFSNLISIQSSGSTTPAFLLKNNNAIGVTTAYQTSGGLGNAYFPTAEELTPGFGAVPIGKATTASPQFYKPQKVNGYLYQFNFDVQRELPNNLLLDVAGIGTYGHHLATAGTAESIDQVNPANQAALLAKYQAAEAEVAASPSGSQAPITAVAKQASILRPFSQFTNVQLLANDRGQSNYRGLNIGLQKRFNNGLQYQVNYTWSLFIDNQQSQSNIAGYPGTDSFTDYYHPRDRYGYSSNDLRNRIIGNALYDLPIGKGKLVNVDNRVLNSVVGGWTISGVSEIHSGTALSPILGGTNVNGSYADGVRPYLIGNPNSVNSSRSREQKIGEWFNTSAFSYDTATITAAHPTNNLYTFGNAPRTFGRGPRLVSTDASLIKRVSLVEGTALELRAEAFNVFNHANLANPNTTYTSTSTTFGTISGLQTGAFASRTLQLAAHLTF